MSARENGTIGRDPLATAANELPRFELSQFIDDRRDATKFHAHYRSLLLQSMSTVFSSRVGTSKSQGQL